MKLYIIAGEASGDLHGSHLAAELLRLQPGLQLRGWGGDRMAGEGVEIVKHYRDLAFMGFQEVLLNIRTILRNIRFCKSDIESFQPDALILIDYPGFNMRIARWAKNKGIRVLYYIAPQAWAWKESRVHQMRRYIDQLYVVLPFEEAYFAGHGIQSFYCGHPLLDEFQPGGDNEHDFRSSNALNSRPIIALLPGSRKQEIRSMLPVMVRMQEKFPDYQLVIAGAPGQTKSFYEEVLGNSDVPVLFNCTSQLLSLAKAGMITSGTATLEAGIHRLPQVVCYKGSAISYAIAKRLVKVKYISLVNLILDRPVVKELIQKHFNTDTLAEELSRLLTDNDYRSGLALAYDQLHLKLGGPGASARTANHMLKILGEPPAA